MDNRLNFQVKLVRILGLDEVPLETAVADKATGLPAGIGI
jgi:hypothetical protein